MFSKTYQKLFGNFSKTFRELFKNFLTRMFAIGARNKKIIMKVSKTNQDKTTIFSIKINFSKF